jgi:hypothetical protein
MLQKVLKNCHSCQAKFYVVTIVATGTSNPQALHLRASRCLSGLAYGAVIIALHFDRIVRSASGSGFEDDLTAIAPVLVAIGVVG